MHITREPSAERWLLDVIKEWLKAQPRAEGWHVSDLLYPRKAYWKRRDPKPITDDEAGYFIAGLGHHFILESIIQGSEKTGKADGGTHRWNGIHYSPDIKTPHPIEIKTSRAKHGPRSDNERELKSEYEGYLAQLSAYMAIDEDTQGKLLVFYLNKEREDGRSVPTFRFFDVTMTPEELGRRQAQLLATKKQLDACCKAKRQMAHRALPLCPAWMCRSCPWADQCKPWLDDPKRKPAAAKRKETL